MTILERLRDANDGLETYLSACADTFVLSTSETAWETLSRVAEKVHGLGPSLGRWAAFPNDIAIQDELRRYKTNIIRLQRRCETAVAELESQSREIWREEQAMRSQQRWQTQCSR